MILNKIMPFTLSPPSTYYGMAVAHARERFNVCVVQKDGQQSIKKNDGLSWREDQPQDMRLCVSRLVRTIGEVAKLQIQAQEHLPSDFWYSMQILTGFHDTPEDFLDLELSKTEMFPETQIPGTESTKEEKGRKLIYNRVLGEIEAGRIQDFPFGTALGQYFLPEHEEEANFLAQEIKPVYERAVKGDEIAMITMKLYGVYIICNAVKYTRKLGIDVSLIKLSERVGEYLNLPEVITAMNEELRRQGLDPDTIKIKFSSEGKSDYYFDVLSPNMEARIKEHKLLLEQLKKDPETIRILRFLETISN